MHAPIYPAVIDPTPPTHIAAVQHETLYATVWCGDPQNIINILWLQPHNRPRDMLNEGGGEKGLLGRMGVKS